MPTTRSSPLYAAIYRAVRSIPTGQVATYGQVASAAGLPGQARLVGYALHRLPDDHDVPWHRVVNARGAISLDTQFGPGLTQRALLESEGIEFNDGGHIDLERFRARLGAGQPVVGN